MRSDVFLYAIGIDSLDARNSTRINPFTLNELTSQGGGYTEIIRSTAELGPATERIAEELNHQYMIGYTPTTRGRRQLPQRSRQGYERQLQRPRAAGRRSLTVRRVSAGALDASSPAPTRHRSLHLAGVRIERSGRGARSATSRYVDMPVTWPDGCGCS